MEKGLRRLQARLSRSWILMRAGKSGQDLNTEFLPSSGGLEKDPEVSPPNGRIMQTAQLVSQRNSTCRDGRSRFAWHQIQCPLGSESTAIEARLTASPEIVVDRHPSA